MKLAALAFAALVAATPAFAVTSTVSITVTHAPTIVLTFVPAAPSVADTLAAGTNVSKVTVSMSDSSAVPAGVVATISAQTPAGIFTLVREGSTQVYDINVGSGGLNVGPATDTVTVDAH